MPITARPDPNHPGQWIWVDSATGLPATQPGGPNTPYVAPSDTTTNPPGGVNIAPAGSGAVPSAPAPAPAPAGPAQGPPSPGGLNAGGYTVAQITAQSDQELLQANADVAKLWDEIHAQQQTVATLSQSTNPLDQQKLTAATSQLNAQYGSLSSAMQRVETANASRATTLQKAIDAATLDPSQVELAKAQATKATTDSQLSATQRDVLQQGSQGQRDLVAAQATQASAAAAAQLATAAATTAKTPAEVAQLQAQATALSAQAKSTEAMIQPLVEKTTAETKLLGVNADVGVTQGQLNQANAASAQADADLKKAQLAAGLPGAQAGLATAQAGAAGGQEAQARAAAAASLAGIQKDKLGPLYGLQDQVNAIQAIQQHIFGPGGSGTPEERTQKANDLLSQFLTATIGGTTPYAASVAAANAGLTGYGTQMSGVNALQAAQASRANAYAGLAGSELGTLAGMNAYAPKGSTAMAGAFQYLQDDMAKRLAAQQFAPAAIPAPPALPSYLQGFANPAGPGGAQPMPNPTPGAPGFAGAQPMPMPAGAPAPMPTANPMPFNPAGPGGAVPMPYTGGGVPQPVPMPAPAPGGPPATLPGMFSKYWQQQYPSAVGQPATGPIAGGLTPQQAFNQGFQANTPTFPNVLQMYGLNMPNPMVMLGGQPYLGMGV